MGAGEWDYFLDTLFFTIKALCSSPVEAILRLGISTGLAGGRYSLMEQIC